MMRQRMEQFNLNSMRLLAGVCGLFTIFALTPVVVAQQSAAVQGGNVSVAAPATAAPLAKTGLAVNPAAKPAEEQKAAAPGKPGNEGIKVHGHWSIDVKNPDGTLAKHVEFENSLVSPGQGDQLLAGLLGGFSVPGDWAIRLVSPSICSETVYCLIFPTLNGPLAMPSCASGSNNGCATGLTLAYVASTTTTGAAFKMSGTLTASGTGNITSVATVFSTCMENVNYSSAATFSPSKCITSETTGLPNAMNSDTFTATTLTTPLGVVPGQIIQVTVTISFS
jgi:hypothetical protein